MRFSFAITYVYLALLPFGNSNFPAVVAVRWTVPDKKKPPTVVGGFMLALPIFPGSHPPSIVGAHELNFCVRDGNRWTLTAINTNSFGWLLTISYVKCLSI